LEGSPAGTPNRLFVRQQGAKARLFDVSTRIPLVRETADPWIFLVLAALVLATLFAVSFPGEVFPEDDDARTHVIQLAAGALVILGAYFTAVNIREARAQQAFERLCRVIDQLGSETEAVRLGALRMLESIALEELDLPGGSTEAVLDARRRAIGEALAAVARDSADLPCGALAREVLQELEARRAADRPRRRSARTAS
jgi:hypothetical protein